MKKRIAVLGGGMGSLSAVYELTRRPGWQDHFEITVYQMGHRLGGKGASGVQAARAHRIEEHGLHVFWGFYENAFRIMRECYRELGRAPDAPLATIEQAFRPHDRITVPERRGSEWDFWPMTAPRYPGAPGESGGEVERPVLLGRMLGALSDLLARTMGATSSDVAGWRAALDREMPRVERVLARLDRTSSALQQGLRDALESVITSIVRGSVLGSLGATRALAVGLEAFFDLELAGMLARRGPPEREGLLSHLLELGAHNLARSIEHGPSAEHRTRVELDFAITLVRGLVRDGMLAPSRDWLALDGEGIRDWLRRHGAAETTVRSGLVDGLLAGAYAIEHDIGAGTFLQSFLRLAFGYQGAILYKMQAGMGETVFAPLFQVLARRGVRFEFFHLVERLELDGARTHVARVVMQRQATVIGDRYAPLVDVKGLPCWPSSPRWEQLVEGEAIRAGGHDLEGWWDPWPGVGTRVLEHGRDFDLVVLGISIGAHRDVCAELIADERNPRYRAMVENVVTTPTQSAQLWLSPALDRFGLDHPGLDRSVRWRADEPPMLIPFAAPFDTWADMSHLLARESWPEHARPGTCAYITAMLPDEEPVPPRGPSDYPERMRARVRENARLWLERSAGELWPGAATTHDPKQLQWWWLVDPEEREGAARLDAQYFSPLPSPSDRYVLSAPGTSAFRLRADESGYPNLILAGDWTRNAISAGCVESATFSGMDAARAIDPGVRPAIGDWLAALRGGAAEAARPRRTSRRPASIPPPRRERAKPRYVVRDGELFAVPPIDLEVDVSMFVLRADAARLQALLDAHLNHGPTEYRVLAPIAVAYCSDIVNRPVPDPFGVVPELDFGIWVPAVAYEHGVAARVVTFTPYIWVSNDVALSNGRSFFGFTKDLGVMQLATDEAPAHTLDTYVIPRFGVDRPIELRRLLEIRRAPRSGARAAIASAASLARVLGESVSMVGPGEAIERAARAIAGAPEGQRMVFLKQFPDAADGRRACYQAVIEADIRITSEVERLPIEGAWEAVIHEYASHRIVTTLGLDARARENGDREIGAAVVPVLGQGRARFRARVESGEVIWEA